MKPELANGTAIIATYKKPSRSRPEEQFLSSVEVLARITPKRVQTRFGNFCRITGAPLASCASSRYRYHMLSWIPK